MVAKQYCVGMKVKMEKKEAHILVVPYPSQGHINPMLHLAKRLASKGATLTLATTHFIITTMLPHQSHPPDHPVCFDIISDGYDQGGFAQAGDVGQYLRKLQSAGSATLTDLLAKYEKTNDSIDCVIYDAFLPWVLDVAKGFGVLGVAFFTQACIVNYAYYCLHHGLLTMPVTPPVALPGLPDQLLQLEDMPSFVYVAGSYPSYFNMVLNQFSNVDKADCVLVNTFYELEKQVVDTMSEVYPLLLTIGPTVPSVYLDNRLNYDKDYGLDLFTPHSPSHSCSSWLTTKPKASVIYVSFGSMACLTHDQMEEIACALEASNAYFLWVVRDSEDDKIPKNFRQATKDKGFVVNWCPQMEVLASEAIGCFFTHCGWNSTMEALSLGVPMVGMPQWTDQPTDAKYVEDVWKVGVRVRVDERGIVRREEIERCIREVMGSGEMKENANKWKALAKQAISEGGSSDRNIDKLLTNLINGKATINK